MSKNILIISGSPKRDGNTAALVEWFTQGASSAGAIVDIVRAADLKHKAVGCTSCRACQKSNRYMCVINDEVSACLARFLPADVIVMASPLYFFGASAQLKCVVDRMFALYKWDNDAGTMLTPLKGKTLVFMGSGFEDTGFDVFEKPFRLTAEYTGMDYMSLLVEKAGVSGEIRNKAGVREQAVALGKECCQEKA